MTVEKLETAQEIVAEAGRDNVKAVYAYKHIGNGKQLYAVFLKGAYVDIFESPFCSEQRCIFADGEWDSDYGK